MTFCVALEARRSRSPPAGATTTASRATCSPPQRETKTVWKRMPRQGTSAPIPLQPGRLRTGPPTPSSPRCGCRGSSASGTTTGASPCSWSTARTNPRRAAMRPGSSSPSWSSSHPTASRSSTAVPPGVTPARAIRPSMPKSRKWRCSIAITSSSASGTASASMPTARGRLRPGGTPRTQAVPAYEVPRTTPPTVADIPALAGLVST